MACASFPCSHGGIQSPDLCRTLVCVYRRRKGAARRSCPTSRSTSDIPAPDDPKFGYSLAQRLAIAEVPKRKPVNPHCNSRSQMGVETCQPVTDQIFSCSGDIPTNLDHATNVSYKLQPRKPESDSEAGIGAGQKRAAFGVGWNRDTSP